MTKANAPKARGIRPRKLSYLYKRERINFLFTLPSLLVLVLFMVVPILMAIGLSFTNWNGLNNVIEWAGVRNYIAVLSTTRFFTVLTNTIWLVILFVPLMNILALILSALIGQLKGQLANVYKSIIFYPCLIALIVVGFVWRLIFNFQNGLINGFLRGIGLDGLARDWLGSADYVLPAITLALLWSGLGYYLVIYVAGIMSVPEEMYEAADMEGCSGVGKFLYITLPMLAPSITINVILSTMNVFTSFGLIFSLTEGGPGYSSQTLALEVYSYAFERLRYPEGLANAVILGLFATVVMLIELKILLKREDVF